MGLLRSAARAAIVGSPSGLATPEKWVVDWFKGGVATPSGVNVDTESALTFGAFYACVRVISEDVSSLPLPLYERLQPRGKRRAPEHPLYRILHDQPNELMGSMQLRETLQGHVVTWGNGTAEIERDRKGNVVALWPLRPDRMEIKTYRKSRGRIEVRYHYNDQVNGIQATFFPDEILHIPGLGFDGIRGYSPVALHRNAIGLGLATEAYGSTFFGNGSRPSGVLKSPRTVSDGARGRMKGDWEQMHRGLDKAQRVAILEEGVEWEAIGIPPEEAQFLQTRKFQRTEMAMIMRLSPHKIQDLERATFSNIEHSNIDHVVSGIRPWLVRWEQAIFGRLLTSSERERYFAEHLVDGLLRGDIETRYKAYQIGRLAGWLNGDDIAEMENRNPLPDGQGEIYLVPLNMVDLDKVAKGDDVRARQTAGARTIEARKNIAARFLPLFADVDLRIGKMEQAEVESLIRRHLEGSKVSPDKFDSALDHLYEGTIEPRTIERWTPIMTVLAGEIAHNAADDLALEDMLEWLEAFAAARATEHAAHRADLSMQRIREASGDPAAIRAVTSSFVEGRAVRTALWETSRVSNATTRETWKRAGVKEIRWVRGTDCPHGAEFDGKVVAIEQDFGPGVALPPLDPECTCSISIA